MNTGAFSTADKKKGSDDQDLEVLGQSSADPHGSLGVTPSAVQGGNTPLGDINLSGVTPVDTNQAHQPDGLHGSSHKQKQTKTQNMGYSRKGMLPKFSGGNPSQNSASASGDVHDAPINAELTPEKPTDLVLSEAPRKHGKRAILDSKYTLADILEYAVYWYYVRPKYIVLTGEQGSWEGQGIIPARVLIATQVLKRVNLSLSHPGWIEELNSLYAHSSEVHKHIRNAPVGGAIVDVMDEFITDVVRPYRAHRINHKIMKDEKLTTLKYRYNEDNNCKQLLLHPFFGCVSTLITSRIDPCNAEVPTFHFCFLRLTP